MSKKYLKLGNTLKKLLFERDMKPIDLAREVNMPPPTIHRLITGKSTRPYRSSLKPIADFFSVTIDQLLGENPLEVKNDLVSAQSDTVGNKVKIIPVRDWDTLKDETQPLSKQGEIIVTNDTDENAFALIMADTSMEPLFPRGCILIFEPGLKPVDRSYILVKLSDTNNYVFRQLLIDLDHQYLKPLNPELSTFKMRLLEKNDSILACLIESRQNFNLSNNKYSEEA
jgi:transcriptional regulator with XRE-family HTH domain